MLGGNLKSTMTKATKEKPKDLTLVKVFGVFLLEIVAVVLCVKIFLALFADFGISLAHCAV